MNWFSHLKFLICNCKFNDGFIENPLMIRDYEIRTYFQRPKIVFKHGWVDEVNSWFSSLFGLCISEIRWKDKYGKARFENTGFISHPFIQINFFGYAFIWEFTCPFTDDEIGTEDAYWESMMDYYNMVNNPHNDSNLYRIIKENTWSNTNHEPYKMTTILTSDGYHKYLEDFTTYKQNEL